MKEPIYQILAYGTFFDFPRGMFLFIEDAVVQLRCDFDDEIDDYKDFYHILVMNGISYEEVQSGAFFHYYERCNKTLIGEIKTSEVTFDSSKRKSLRSKALLKIIRTYKQQTL
ncbi:MAG: hypothetical protein QM758_08155 [Armatimonas sp.]